MKNYSLLHFDESRSIWRRIFRNCYRYPIVYEDGLISYLKTSSAGRKAWGYVVGGYAISFFEAPDFMQPEKAKAYCQSVVVFGRSCCVPPLSVFREVLRRRLAINELIFAFKGNPIQASCWYMVENDKWRDADGNLKQSMCGAHLNFPDNHCAILVSRHCVLPFYPAIKLFF